MTTFMIAANKVINVCRWGGKTSETFANYNYKNINAKGFTEAAQIFGKYIKDPKPAAQARVCMCV